jgi:hypothetical protein
MLFKVPGVWAEDNPLGLVINIPSVVTEIKLGVTPVRVGQYLISMRAQKRDVSSPPESLELCNTDNLSICLEHFFPLLPVQKSGTNDYHPVQDLWAVN